MAIGQRIKYFRNLKGMTQKELGLAVGFTDKTSDVRIAQYESEARVPKEDMLKSIAEVLDVSPKAINVPEIDTYNGLMMTLFALEDMYGLKIKNIDGELCLTPEKVFNPSYPALFDKFLAWQQMSEKCLNDEITKEEYDNWRYNYPRSAISNLDEILNS
ncbi:MAG: helix-turn-helix transcriptional regulator [Firmicutes bacterium]|nr:helix-turn-helix transcriptional regulator [Bacillota bacterium]